MTQDEIIRMAAQVEWEISGHDFPHSDEFIQWCERFAALVAAAERERIKQANAPEIERINAHIKALEEAVAAAIRSRGNK